MQLINFFKICLLNTFLLSTFAVTNNCVDGIKYYAMINNHEYITQSCDICMFQRLTNNKLYCESYGVVECTIPMINMLYNDYVECLGYSNITTIFTDIDFPIKLTKQTYPIGHYMNICVKDNPNQCELMD